MIELVFEDRCTGCGLCVDRCPTNVFELDDAGTAVIARQEDCQTCYLCEVHCPEDALFVGPLRYPHLYDPQAVLASGNVGNLRRAFGFDKHEVGTHCYYGPYTLKGLMPHNPLDPNVKIHNFVSEVENRSLVSPPE